MNSEQKVRCRYTDLCKDNPLSDTMVVLSLQRSVETPLKSLKTVTLSGVPSDALQPELYRRQGGPRSILTTTILSRSSYGQKNTGFGNAADKFTMDCIDCHNRIGHPFPNPEEVIDQALLRRPAELDDRAIERAILQQSGVPVVISRGD